MRAALLLVLALPAAADGIAKAQAIAKAGPEAARAAIPELIALGKGLPADRFAARDALAVAGPPAIAKLIEGVAGDASLRLLLEGVSFDLGAGVVAPALPLLSSDNPKIRAAAAAALGAAGPGGEAAVKKLIELLYDKDAEVRREAALALGGIGRGAHDATSALILLADDRERGTTREALLALGMILRDAAERERHAPSPPADVARAIDSATKWLAAQQRPDGSWACPGPRSLQPHFTALSLLALLDSGEAERHAPVLRAGLRYLLSGGCTDAAGDPEKISMAAGLSLCVAMRVLDEPECRLAAEPIVGLLAKWGTEELKFGAADWRALVLLEARFAGLPVEGSALALRPDAPTTAAEALTGVAAGIDPAADAGLNRALEHCIPNIGNAKELNPNEWFVAARAFRYGRDRGYKIPEAPVAAIVSRQREDGSWEATEEWVKYGGEVYVTAALLLALEATASSAHPLELPLPDAPQLKAAVATLKIARQSKDEAIRAAAEQALAGFAVR